MNREILFRGKLINNGEWVYGFLTKAYNSDKNEINYVIQHVFFELENVQIDSFFVDPKTVGQFSGKTNKNGNKVFEHDIVKDEHGRIYEISVDEIHSFKFKNGKDEFYKNCMNKCEIIGNIHDNPDLFKGEELS